MIYAIFDVVIYKVSPINSDFDQLLAVLPEDNTANSEQ
jgi:hypothetical protein